MVDTEYCFLVALLLPLISLTVPGTGTAAALSPPYFSARISAPALRRHHLRPVPPSSRLSAAPDANDGDAAIADIEEITAFASDSGVELAFTTKGPGYRGIARARNDPENILGYIEGFLRPGGRILHADKMEMFNRALRNARAEEPAFRGGGTFLGPGLLVAFVCLLHGRENGCADVEFLAIDDAEFQHRRLIRYYRTAGFREVRYVGEELKDIPDRLVWGGCGTLMTSDIDAVLRKWTRIIRRAKGKMEN